LNAGIAWTETARGEQASQQHSGLDGCSEKGSTCSRIALDGQIVLNTLGLHLPLVAEGGAWTEFLNLRRQQTRQRG
jgi:hypothetical protein